MDGDSLGPRVLVTLLLLGAAARGQALVKDINAAVLDSASAPAAFAFSSGYAYFAANDGPHGSELWRSDGTATGTTLVKDIAPAPAAGSSITSTVAFQGGVLFSASDGAIGAELWRSDGTAAGTVLVKDIHPVPVLGSAIANLTVLLGRAWFSADDGTHGPEPWVSDGTTAGTFMVKDIEPAAATGSRPAHFTELGGKVYFSAADAAAGRELWVTDGTAAGTSLVRDFHAGPASGLSSTAGFAALNVLGGKLLVAANHPAYGNEWWTSDGTAAGTALLADFQPGTGSGIVSVTTPDACCVAGGKLFWYGTTGAALGDEVGFTDGTAAGTGLLDIAPGPTSSTPFPFHGWNGKCYVQANDGTSGFECFVTDGTPAGTHLLKDIHPGPASAANTSFLGTATALFFLATEASTGQELWRTDGTAAGTTLVRDIDPGPATAAVSGLVTDGALLYFAATDGVLGAELWRSDGTGAGTKLVLDINSTGTTPASSAPSSLAALGDRVCFQADDGVHGAELWITDGTAAGTALLKDIRPGPAGSAPASLTVLGGKIVFTADDGTSGTELWVTDGTAAGTQQLLDANAGSPGSSPGQLTVSGGRVFCSAFAAATGNELYVSDGTAAGTGLVTDLEPGAGSGFPSIAGAITAFGAGVMFRGDDGVTGAEPFYSDGTAAGTRLVKDVYPGSSGSSPVPMKLLGGTVYMQANDGVAGFELWRSDGTPAGTVRILDINPGASSSYPTSFTQLAGRVVFTATDTTSATGTELWSSDGTAAGTTLLKDINPGVASSSPTGLVVAGDALFFVAAEPLQGRELWVTDGTTSGTRLANDTSPGTGSGASSAPFAIGAGRRVIVALTDGGNGSGTEPWVSDGTPAGTARVRDLNPGGAGSSPAGFVVLADLVLFSADDGSAGIELWAARLAELGASEAAPFGVNCKGALDPRITFSGAPALASPTFSVALTGAVASSPAALFLAAQRVDMPFAGCTIYPSLTPTISFSATTSGTGTAAVTMPIPGSAAFLGASFWFQWVTVDLGGPILGVASLSNGLRIRIGRS